MNSFNLCESGTQTVQTAETTIKKPKIKRSVRAEKKKSSRQCELLLGASCARFDAWERSRGRVGQKRHEWQKILAAWSYTQTRAKLAPDNGSFLVCRIMANRQKRDEKSGEGERSGAHEEQDLKK